MKRLILLATAAFLRKLARLPLGIARGFANAADWLEGKADPFARHGRYRDMPADVLAREFSREDTL